MANARVLLVDDSEVIRESVGKYLTLSAFDVTTAANVAQALECIGKAQYDVLLTDLHMPGAGDGLTVVSAMRHAHPQAVTMLLSSFPEMNAAAQAIMLQTDQILVKPLKLATLVKEVRDRLTIGSPPTRMIESVATILERAQSETIQLWLEYVQGDPALTSIALTGEQRCSHLPQVFADLVERLRSSRPIGHKESTSPAFAEHGTNRRKQGYTAAMLVEESRMLQVSIFETLQRNLDTIDFSVVLLGVMTIADEIDSQLSQAMSSFVAESREGTVAAQRESPVDGPQKRRSYQGFSQSKSHAGL